MAAIVDIVNSIAIGYDYLSGDEYRAGTIVRPAVIRLAALLSGVYDPYDELIDETCQANGTEIEPTGKDRS